MAGERPLKRIRLVDYSDSDEEDTEPTTAPTQDNGRQKKNEEPLHAEPGPRPPNSVGSGAPLVTVSPSSPPPKFKMSVELQDMYAYHNAWRGVNDPALHGGRRKMVQLPEGHWPGFIFLEWRPTESEAHLLQILVEQLKWPIPLERKALVEGRVLDCGRPQPLHISLSRTLPLPQSREDEFLRVLRRAVWNLHLSPVTVTPAKLTWLENEDGTMYFLVFTVACEDEALRALLQTVNGVAKQELDVGLEEAEVDDWLFHITFGVTKSSEIARNSGVRVTPYDPERRRRLEKFKSYRQRDCVDTQFDEFVAKSGIRFDAIKLRCGNSLHHIPFDEKDKIPEKSPLDKILRR